MKIMYIKREIEDRLKYMSEHFSVVMVCGARQIGKTTLLQHLKEKNNIECSYVTLDYPN